jgi:ATP-dependent DNA helicase RecG
MAPTEILAMQHFQSFSTLMPRGIRLALLTGSTPPQEKKSICGDVTAGTVDIVIGTHALIQEDVTFRSLGLIIIDEQHRFGVAQRAALREKGDTTDLLIMTATPIPRSLSLTLYGDLDASLIREKPSSRLPIKTMAFPRSRLKGVYNSVEKYIAEGRQAYYVLPLIEESEKSDLKSAKETFGQLKDGVFSHRRVELLHGRMKADEKDAIMRRFRNGETDILVSTTVIEVGIDVPNASVMVVEHAERFGLSQLHQLRGRVGRGAHQSFCVLVYPDDIPDESRRRIEILTAIDDGFRIAEEDLRLRGAGEMIGVRQHGYDSGFEFTDLASDLELIVSAREEASKAVAQLADAKAALEDIRGEMRHSEILKGIRTKKILSILS